MSISPNVPSPQESYHYENSGTPRWIAVLFGVLFVALAAMGFFGYTAQSRMSQELAKAEDNNKLLVQRLDQANASLADLKGHVEVTEGKLGMTTAELAKANVRIPIIFITGYGDIPMTVQAMKAGAVEFLTKPFRDQDLLDAVRTGLDCDSARREREQALSGVVSAYETLSAREKEVFPLVTSGLMNKQIAAKLGVSEITVKVHRRNVTRKMGARSRAALVRMAALLGIRQQES